MKQILKMLEDPESDKDELNARICCYNSDIPYRPAQPGQRYGFRIVPNYTTSLDAAMSIGAEELEGWHLIRTVKAMASGRLVFKTGFQKLGLDAPGLEHMFLTFENDIEDLFCAICHARCQALDYVRGL